MGAIGVVFHVNPNASEAEQPGNDRVPSLMIGGLTASLAGVDRAQPDGALERFKFPANPTLMGPVQPADTRHEEQVQTPISVELARDGEGVLVVRRLPCPCNPSLKPLVHRHGLEVQQRQRGPTKGTMDAAHGFGHHDRSRSPSKPSPEPTDSSVEVSVEISVEPTIVGIYSELYFQQYFWPISASRTEQAQHGILQDFKNP